MSSPFFGVLRAFSLQFRVSTGTYERDARGNLVPVVRLVTILCTLRPLNAPFLRGVTGLNEHEITLQGRCLEPMSLPTGVGPGSEAGLILYGRTGTFCLDPFVPSPIPELEEALGTRFVGRWRAA